MMRIAKEEVSKVMAGARRNRKKPSTGPTSEKLGPIRLEDIPWAEIIIDPESEAEKRQAPYSRHESEAAPRDPNIVVPADQVPNLGQELGQHSLPLLPVLVLALAMLCLLALGSGITPDF